VPRVSLNRKGRESICHLRDRNIRDRIPVGWYRNLADTVVALDRVLTARVKVPQNS
jgi:hypothetical protein